MEASRNESKVQVPADGAVWARQDREGLHTRQYWMNGVSICLLVAQQLGPNAGWRVDVMWGKLEGGQPKAHEWKVQGEPSAIELMDAVAIGVHATLELCGHVLTMLGQKNQSDVAV